MWNDTDAGQLGAAVLAGVCGLPVTARPRSVVVRANGNQVLQSRC